MYHSSVGVPISQDYSSLILYLDPVTFRLFRRRTPLVIDIGVASARVAGAGAGAGVRQLVPQVQLPTPQITLPSRVQEAPLVMMADVIGRRFHFANTKHKPRIRQDLTHITRYDTSLWQLE